jgi:hypothetical protein
VPLSGRGGSSPPSDTKFKPLACGFVRNFGSTGRSGGLRGVYHYLMVASACCGRPSGRPSDRAEPAIVHFAAEVEPTVRRGAQGWTWPLRLGRPYAAFAKVMWDMTNTCRYRWVESRTSGGAKVRICGACDAERARTMARNDPVRLQRRGVCATICAPRRDGDAHQRASRAPCVADLEPSAHVRDDELPRCAEGCSAAGQR